MLNINFPNVLFYPLNLNRFHFKLVSLVLSVWFSSYFIIDVTAILLDLEGDRERWTQKNGSENLKIIGYCLLMVVEGCSLELQK